jgi:Protein of unknown function (DUF3579)
MDPQATPSVPPQEIVIQGVTESGQKFRPSDWAERLCGMMSVFSDDRHLSYSPYLKPVIADGMNCVVVDARLEALDPAAFRFLLAFAHDNELRTRPGRNPGSGGAGPGLPERRVPEPQQEAPI